MVKRVIVDQGNFYNPDGTGPDGFPPEAWFKFSMVTFDHWFDGWKRNIYRGFHIPYDMTIETFTKRLERAAYIRGAQATIFVIDGQISVLCVPWDKHGKASPSLPPRPPVQPDHWVDPVYLARHTHPSPPILEE